MFLFITVIAVLAVLYYRGVFSVKLAIGYDDKTFKKTFDRSTH